MKPILSKCSLYYTLHFEFNITTIILIAKIVFVNNALFPLLITKKAYSEEEAFYLLKNIYKSPVNIN